MWEREEVQEVPRLLAGRGALLAGASALVLSIAAVAEGAETPVSAFKCPAPAGAVLQSSASTPSAQPPLPGRAVVCVGALSINAASVAHWFLVAKREEAHGHSQQLTAAAERGEAVTFLIEANWVKSEATALEVFVTPVDVKRHFDRIRGQQFPKRREFDAFLRSSGQTVGDLLFRVEQHLLMAGIERHIFAAYHTASGRERALRAFAKGFRARWKTQTTCMPEFKVDACGHLQATL